MAADHLKTPYGWRVNELATRRAMDAIQGTGRALPASVVSGNGTFVTVNFEWQSPFTLPQVRVPVLASEYFRAPIGPGCKGVVIPADYSLGGVSGLRRRRRALCVASAEAQVCLAPSKSASGCSRLHLRRGAV